MRPGIGAMLTCRWAARRIQWYVDADPSSPLTADEERRLAAHLAICARCAELAASHRWLRATLGDTARRPQPDPASVARLRERAERIRSGADG